MDYLRFRVNVPCILHYSDATSLDTLTIAYRHGYLFIEGGMSSELPHLDSSLLKWLKGDCCSELGGLVGIRRNCRLDQEFDEGDFGPRYRCSTEHHWEHKHERMEFFRDCEISFFYLESVGIPTVFP